MFSKVFALTLVAFAAAATAKTTWKDLDGYSFEAFMQEYNMKFSASEMESRRALFTAELTRVRAHNAKNLSWKEGMTKWSAMTAEERKASYGRSKGVAQAQGKSLKNIKEAPLRASKATNPDSVDWRDAGIVSAVKDQGHCGSCWAFATTATIESFVAKETDLLFDLSVQQIAMCAPNPDSCGGTGGCEGATSEIGMDYVASSAGLFQEYQYSYGSYYGTDYECAIPTATTPVATISGFTKLAENNYSDLMDAVATLGPIAVSVDASTWHAYESGIYNGCDQASPDINHAVVLVGYGSEDGEDYWLVRNSWSAAYGEAGYIRLHRGSDEETNCGSDTTPQDGTACAGETAPVTVCGTCGILYDSAYPLGAAAL